MKQKSGKDPYSRDRVRTWIEIDTKAVAKNYHTFRKLIGKKTKLLAVVKSNAYGHNLYDFSSQMQKLGADWLGVDSLIEGIKIRERGITTPILVLGYTLPTLYDNARASGISVAVSSFAQLNAIDDLKKGKPLAVHIKVDTGMHRQGFQWDERDELISRLLKAVAKGHIVVEGIFTHLAEAKTPSSSDRTVRQLHAFDRWIDLVKEQFPKVIVHAAATGGALLYPKGHYDMVRIGIGLYGLWPSPESERALSQKLTLHPVLTWKAVVGEVKGVQKGERIGYDFTEVLMRDSKVAIIPVGYWHGFRRGLSSKGRVLIKGKSARVLGRVSMDMIAVDVTDIPGVAMGEEVILIGKSGKERIKAGEIASFLGTTHYETVTTLNPLIKRFYL